MKKILSFMLISFAMPLFCGNYGVPAKYVFAQGCNDARAVEVVDNFLYVGTKNSVLVYDITVPAKPRKLYELKNTGPARQMASSGNYLYITRRERGIIILDIRNRALPVIAGFYDTVEMATGIELAGNLLFCAQRIYGVETLDISDPVNPRPLSLQRTHEAQSCFWKDGLLYVGDWGASKLTVIDMNKPTAPRKLCEKPLDGYGDGVFTDDKFCYAATGHHARSGSREERFGRGHGLEIFSLEDPRDPRKLSVVKFPKFHVTGNDYWSVRVSGNTAVVADTHNGVFIVDVTDRRKPVIRRHAVFPAVKKSKSAITTACVADIRLGDKVIYTAVQGVGLAVIEEKSVQKNAPRSKKTTPISQTAKAPLKNYDRYDFNSTVRRVAVKGNIAYTACSVGGLKVFDLKSRKVIQSISDICAYDAAVDGGKLYCAAGSDGIVVYQINADHTLKEVFRRKRFYIPNKRWNVNPHVQMLMKPSTGGLLVFSDRSAHIYFADTAKDLDVVLRESWIRLLYGDSTADDDINGILPVHCCGFGTLWFKIKDSTVKVVSRETQHKNVSGQSEGWTVFNGRFLAPSRRGCTLLDAENHGRDFKAVKVARTSGTASAAGSIVAFANRVKGTVRVFDFTDVSKPVELKEFALDISGTPDRIRFWNGHLIVPAGLDGLLISKNCIRSK